MRSLSGGNAQKLVLRPRARHGARRSSITCHPTRGLDPGAAATVADRLLDAAAAGAAVVWMGAELEEVLAVAHRVIVLSRGRITGEFARPFDRSAIGLAMGGGAGCHGECDRPSDASDAPHEHAGGRARPVGAPDGPSSRSPSRR